MPKVLILLFVAGLPAMGPCGAEDLPAGSGTPLGYGPQGCQVALLRNGFRIEYLRREAAGSALRLWLCGNGGYVEIPSEQIEVFEDGPAMFPPAPAAPATASGTTAGDPLKSLIARAALRYQIDPDFLASVMKAESGFVPTAVSPKGALGLMQLMPRTAAGLGVKDVLDPAANAEGGTRYLRQLLDRYDGDAVRALAAYNAGPQQVDQHGGIPPLPETRAFVARVIADYNRRKLPVAGLPR
jgi:hypothetical protein